VFQTRPVPIRIFLGPRAVTVSRSSGSVHYVAAHLHCRYF
jgi:hypothetical protein